MSTTENYDRRVVSKSSCQTSVNQHKNKVDSRPYHTVYRATKNVPVSLHSTFQILANMQNDDTCVQNINASSRVSSKGKIQCDKYSDTEVCSFQHSHECKRSTSPLGVNLQPQLAVQANCVSKGNKTELGLSWE